MSLQQSMSHEHAAAAAVNAGGSALEARSRGLLWALF